MGINLISYIIPKASTRCHECLRVSSPRPVFYGGSGTQLEKNSENMANLLSDIASGRHSIFRRGKACHQSFRIKSLSFATNRHTHAHTTPYVWCDGMARLKATLHALSACQHHQPLSFHTTRLIVIMANRGRALLVSMVYQTCEVCVSAALRYGW